MKTTIFALFVLCIALSVPAAHAQNTVSVLPNTVQPMTIPEHTAHADHHAMATEQFLVGNGNDVTYTYEKGEQPLWEFGPVTPEIPLGDVARAYRNGRGPVKKAEKVLEKQGS